MLECPAILFGHICLGCLADVIANVYFGHFCCLAGVIAIYYFCGRCWTTCFVSCLIELTCGQMLLPFISCDWCDCHIWYSSLWLILLSLVLQYIALVYCRTLQHCDTFRCWKCLRLTFSSDLEEAMLETGESLSTNKFKFCFWENLQTYMNEFCLEQ